MKIKIKMKILILKKNIIVIMLFVKQNKLNNDILYDIFLYIFLDK